MLSDRVIGRAIGIAGEGRLGVPLRNSEAASGACGMATELFVLCPILLLAGSTTVHCDLAPATSERFGAVFPARCTVPLIFRIVFLLLASVCQSKPIRLVVALQVGHRSCGERRPQGPSASVCRSKPLPNNLRVFVVVAVTIVESRRTLSASSHRSLAGCLQTNATVCGRHRSHLRYVQSVGRLS